jgi:hypothetical protein
MVVLKITELLLPPGVTHLATDWQVATDLQFTNVIISSMGDNVNLSSIMFNDALDPTSRYYARARSLLTTGYTVWGNIDVTTPNYLGDLDLRSEMPSVLSTPILTSSSDVTNHLTTMFTLSVHGYSSYGTGTHESTTWIIEDIFGVIVWEHIADTINLNNMLICDVILKENNAYRARAIFNSSSNDSSQVATMTFITSGDINASIVSTLNDIVVNKNYTLDFMYNIGVSSLSVIIYQIHNDSATQIFYIDVPDTDFDTVSRRIKPIVTANIFASNMIYIMLVKTNLDNVFKAIQFSTY